MVEWKRSWAKRAKRGEIGCVLKMTSGSGLWAGKTGEVSKDISSYETRLKTVFEGCTAAAWLRLVLIVDVGNYTKREKPEQKGSSWEGGTVFDSFAVVLR